MGKSFGIYKKKGGFRKLKRVWKLWKLFTFVGAVGLSIYIITITLMRMSKFNVLFAGIALISFSIRLGIEIHAGKNIRNSIFLISVAILDLTFILLLYV